MQVTVGFRDFTPHDHGIRLRAGVQVLAGQILLLFGFAEIMRSRRVQMAGGGKKPAIRRPLSNFKPSGYTRRLGKCDRTEKLARGG
ncbi:MAG: hypothetical protein FJX33_11100 [Alphaproteobacteria bacterium]|nr:hypothetical protein [Alphaproteobacteria bacterium]